MSENLYVVEECVCNCGAKNKCGFNKCDTYEEAYSRGCMYECQECNCLVWTDKECDCLNN